MIMADPAAVKRSFSSSSSSVLVAPESLRGETALDCERVNKYTSAGIALNPFGGVGSELDSLIFDGFKPHDLLHSKWYIS